MKNKNNWFSIIETIVATSILTIAVFWVYKLIAENNKIITNSWNYLNSYSLISTLTECIENIWFNNYDRSIWKIYEFNFWENIDKCILWNTYNINIDNIEYGLKWKIINSSDFFIDWQLEIESSQAKTITWSYKQIKK